MPFPGMGRTSTKVIQKNRREWLWEITHVRGVVGSNPSAIYWMYLTFFSNLFGVKIEKTENKRKRDRDLAIFNYCFN